MSNVTLTRRAGRDVPPSRQLAAPRAPTRHVHKASSVTAVTKLVPLPRGGQDIVCRTASGEARRECLASTARVGPRPTEAERLRESVRIAAAIQLVPLPRGGQESVQISNDTTSAGNLHRQVGPSSPTTSSCVHHLTPACRVQLRTLLGAHSFNLMPHF